MKNDQTSSNRIGFEFITHGVGKEAKVLLDQFVAEYSEHLAVDPVPPCEGATIVSRHSWSECDGTFWNIKERTVWRCPDGEIKTTEQIVQETDHECSWD